MLEKSNVDFRRSDTWN